MELIKYYYWSLIQWIKIILTIKGGDLGNKISDLIALIAVKMTNPVNKVDHIKKYTDKYPISKVISFQTIQLASDLGLSYKNNLKYLLSWT